MNCGIIWCFLSSKLELYDLKEESDRAWFVLLGLIICIFISYWEQDTLGRNSSLGACWIDLVS